MPKPINSRAPSLTSMLGGEPERIIQATKSPRILITWLHADEELAPRVAHHIYTERPDLATHVDFICGNPKAAAHPESVGFLETDLNRSFKTELSPTSYEEKRAKEILALAEKYDYVLDLHVSVDPEFGNCIAVIKNRLDEPAVQDLIAAAPNQRALVISETAVPEALITVVTNGIAIEYSVTTVESQGVSDMIALIDALISGRRQSIERELYHVEGTIPKTEDPGTEARNFVFWKPGGYYPVLIGTGPRSYREDPTKDYCCFYAKHMEKIVL